MRRTGRLPEAARKGISEASARSDTPSTKIPHTKIQPPASRLERTGARTCLPASMRAGAEKAAFIKEYSSALPAPARSEEGSGPPPDNRIHPIKTGTSKALSRLTPRIPRRKKSRTTPRPASDARGTRAGKSASSAASIPAQGTKESASRIQPTASPARPKSAAIAPPNPPCRRPRMRKKALRTQDTKQESANAPAPPVRKKHTSSAPVRNPAPTVIPTRKKAVRTIPISDTI